MNDWSKFYKEMEACKNMYGYFTMNVEDAPKIAYIERLEDEDGSTYYKVRHPELFDRYIWDEASLYEYLDKRTWAWTFHPCKEVA